MKALPKFDLTESQIDLLLSNKPTPTVKEETKMYYPYTDANLSGEKNHLSHRLKDVGCKATNVLRGKFHLEPDPWPRSYKEMRERLLAGKFTLPADEDVYVEVCPSSIIWQHPDNKTDREGYIKAERELETKMIATHDIIVIKTPEEGLAAVQSLEKQYLN